jgi:hypothetical protein
MQNSLANFEAAIHMRFAFFFRPSISAFVLAALLAFRYLSRMCGWFASRLVPTTIRPLRLRSAHAAREGS